MALLWLSTHLQQGWSVVKISLSLFRLVVLLISSCQLRVIFSKVDRSCHLLRHWVRSVMRPLLDNEIILLLFECDDG